MTPRQPALAPLVVRCLARYGSRRQHVCGRRSGHTGPHALRMTITELLAGDRPRPKASR